MFNLREFIKEKQKAKHKAKQQKKTAFKIQYYEENIMPLLQEVWEDKELVRLTGVESLIAKDAHISREMTKEEIEEAFARTVRIAAKFPITLKRIDNDIYKYIDIHKEISEEFENFKKKTNKGIEEFYYLGDMYLIDIFKEVYESVVNIELTDPRITTMIKEKTVEELLENINSSFKLMADFVKLTPQILASSTNYVVGTVSILNAMEAARKNVSSTNKK